MAKAVFRPNELVTIPEKVMLNVPLLDTAMAVSSDAEDEEAEPEIELYTGPTAEDLRREAEEFTAQWNIEKEEMIQAAKDRAEAIVQSARQSAEEEKQRGADEVLTLKASAQEEAGRIIADAKLKAEALLTETRKTLEDEKKTALEDGREAGRIEGYAEGKIEVDRLIERTQIVLERAQDKRGEILNDTERDIIDLVLLITRKVVKVIADNQREVIISNVEHALKKVRDRGDIIIHVNTADLKLTTEHTKEFIKMLEGAKSIQVAEDSSVDPGGCIIETDFGEVDARISSQLSEMEMKIREISPIKSKMKIRETK